VTKAVMAKRAAAKKRAQKERERIARRDALVNNLVSFYVRNVTAEDKRDGMRWYGDARAWCLQQCEKYKVQPHVVMEVVAALSPNNKWSRNLVDATIIFDAVRSGKTPSDVKVCTFTRNKEKAFRIAQGNERIVWSKNTQKTFSFTDNIADENSERVTVDGHAKNVADNALRPLSDPGTAVGAHYATYEQAYQIAAKCFGLKGYEFQAIVWVAWKRVHNIY
jgi:hypothetical protein